MINNPWHWFHVSRHHRAAARRDPHHTKPIKDINAIITDRCNNDNDLSQTSKRTIAYWISRCFPFVFSFVHDSSSAHSNASRTRRMKSFFEWSSYQWIVRCRGLWRRFPFRLTIHTHTSSELARKIEFHHQSTLTFKGDGDGWERPVKQSTDLIAHQ